MSEAHRNWPVCPFEKRSRVQVLRLSQVVDAKDEKAHQFYVDFGFIPFPDSKKKRLLLPMARIEKTFTRWPLLKAHRRCDARVSCIGNSGRTSLASVLTDINIYAIMLIRLHQFKVPTLEASLSLRFGPATRQTGSDCLVLAEIQLRAE